MAERAPGATAATYRAEVIGSLLRPEAVKRAMQAAAAGSIGPDELAAVQERAIVEAVAKQAACGLDTVSDGEAVERANRCSSIIAAHA